MSKKINDDEKRLFREALKKLGSAPKRNAPTTQNTTIHYTKHLSDHESRHLARADAKLHFARSGISTQQLKRLSCGDYTPYASLDLHGLTVEQSRTAVLDTVHHALYKQQRCILIIHGKNLRGNRQPTLKNKINNWLPQFDEVLAFCSASPKLGGSGATFVLLKNMKKVKDK